MKIKVLKDILGANEQLAQKNRELLDRQGIFTVNLMSSPGAGKTSLIVSTIRRLKGKVKVGVIEGDVSSSWDAEIVGKEDVPVIQINTEGGCHLDANMIQLGLNNLPLEDIELLFIENIGNLICPAEFALGEHRKVLVSSLPEGDDKPHKYPLMFQEVDAVLLNKIDLLPYLKFDMEAYTEVVRGLNPDVEIMPLSCTSGEGFERWTAWLLAQMKNK